jgi:hypothetical protein
MVTNHGKEQSPHGHRDLTPVVWAILVMGMSSFHQAITNCTDQKKAQSISVQTQSAGRCQSALLRTDLL